MAITEYKSLSEKRVWKTMRKPDPTLILFHFRPDGHAVGSAFALRSVLVQMGMQVRCLCANAVPARLRFLTSDAEDAVEEET